AIDQMKEIYIDGTLEPIETANWFPKVIRKDYTLGVNVSETAVDDPDQMFYENYACGSDRNYTGYCDKEVDALIDQQSAEPDAEKRRHLVWEIERRLARDASRPIIFYTRAATCWRPRVKGLTRRCHGNERWAGRGVGSVRPHAAATAACHDAAASALKIRRVDREMRWR